MSIAAPLAEAVNDQIQVEFQSAYQYLAMAAWFTESNLHGFAHWMQMQWQEETLHAMKLYGFLHHRGGRVVLRALEAPTSTYQSPLHCFEEVLKHEERVTKKINELYELAMKEKDLPLQIMLQWFINEQVEEEAQVTELVDRLNLVGSDSTALFLLDSQLAGRPAPTSAGSST